MLTSKFQSWQYLVKMSRLFWRPSGVLARIIKSSAYSKYLILCVIIVVQDCLIGPVDLPIH